MEARAVIASPPAGVDVTLIHESKTNPRRVFDEAKLSELADSIAKHGVMQAVLLRPLPKKAGHFELVAGARRLRASIKAGLAEIPATVRDLTDVEVLELQLIENLQRDDLDALAEAEGYQRLVKTGKYDVGTIASRIGKSPAYVYDRLKLLDLIPEFRGFLEADRISARHAVLLARLPEDQQRVALERRALWTYSTARALTEAEEDAIGDAEEKAPRKGAPRPGEKVVSVRELQGRIDERLRFRVEEPVNTQIFPETVKAVEAAAAADVKLVKITHEHYVQETARDADERTFGPQSWKPAEPGRKEYSYATGKRTPAKACDRSVLGVFVVGPERGKTARVCIDKKGCKVHWAEEQRASERRAKEREKAAKKGDKNATATAPAVSKWEAEEARRKAGEKRWEAAAPAIEKAFLEALGKAKVGPGSGVAAVIVESLRHEIGAGVNDAEKAVGLGKTAESFLRFIAAAILLPPIRQAWDPAAVGKDLARLGVDAKKIIAAHEKAAAPAKPAKGRKA